MASPSIKKIEKARQTAMQGVDYSPRSGASCPWCGSRTRITNTQKWDGDFRIRYHRCEKKGCVLATMGVSIKSIEADIKERV